MHQSSRNRKYMVRGVLVILALVSPFLFVLYALAIWAIWVGVRRVRRRA